MSDVRERRQRELLELPRPGGERPVELSPAHGDRLVGRVELLVERRGESLDDGGGQAELAVDGDAAAAEPVERDLGQPARLELRELDDPDDVPLAAARHAGDPGLQPAWRDAGIADVLVRHRGLRQR